MAGIAVGVFGVAGVGKSTLLDAHVERHPEDVHIGGSTVVKAIIAPSSVRDLDGWPAARQVAVREESIRRLQTMREAALRCLLVAGHFTLRNRRSGQVERILTDSDHAFFDALVHLDAPAERILQQTQSDSRRRHAQDTQSVSEHAAHERIVAQETATLMAVPFVRIQAPSMEERLAELESFLQRVAAVRHP